MERPKRQTRKPGKYDEEFIIPAEAAEIYWEANTRQVYRFLTEKDVKSSLKHSTVHILWPGDGKWYLAEVEELHVAERIANLRYPETNEEEEVDLQELIQERCIAVVEHLPRATKLKKGREVPCRDEDAEGVEYESGDEAEAEQLQQQRQRQQQQSNPRQPSARKAHALEDDDYDAEQDSDAVPMSDDEKLDSDAHVSDDQAPSGSDEERLAAKAKKSGSRQLQYNSKGAVLGPKQQARSRLNTPSKGNNKPIRTAAAAGAGGIGPVATPGLLPMMSAEGSAAAGAGSMLFVPMGATGTVSAAGHSAGNGVLWSAGSGDSVDVQHQQQQQGMLGKRRTSEGYGMPRSEAKRRAAAAADREAAAPATGSDAFKKAMLEKLLAKRQQTSGSGSGGLAAAAAATGGTARVSSTKLARGVSGTERRLSGSGSAALQRALSDVDVRQKAAGQLAVGLKKAVEEAHEKQQAQQQQWQQASLQHHQQQETVEQQCEDGEAGAADAEMMQQQPGALDAQQPRDSDTAAATGPETAGQASVAKAAEHAQQPDQGQQHGQQQQQQEQQQDVPRLQLSDAQQLATTIEQQLYDLCGSLTAEYKSKMRSLVFNLRDPHNPDLRVHVMTGHISPSQLVRMSAADLANKDLAEWRKKIEEEHNKSIELDLETAAKYSTAAAWATREDRLRRTQMALLGTLAAEDNKRSTPEPPLAAGATAEGSTGKAAQRNRIDTGTSGAAAADSDSRAGQSMSEAELDTAAEVGTPTRPAEEGAEEEDSDQGWGDGGNGSHKAATADDAATKDNGNVMQWQPAQQLSSPTAVEHAAAGDAGLLSTPSLSQGGVPASSATASTALQPVDSVTSRAPLAAGGIFAGIDWAAIKKDAVKASKEQPQQPQQSIDGMAAVQVAAPMDDAPYNPDDDDDEQPYDPAEGNACDTHSHDAPSAAAKTAAAAASSRPGYSEPVDPHLPDMLPVITAPTSSRSSCTGQDWPSPGDVVWTGRFLVPAAGSFNARVQHLAGMGEVGLMLGPAGAAVEVIGRVALDKFAAFAEELRKSRSRTISLGLVDCAPGADAVDAAYIHELLQSYSSKGRIGKLGLAKDVEGYLVAKSELTARLLKTAILVTPPSQQHLFPRDVAGDQFLLLLVHRKDFIPPKPMQLPPPSPPPQQQQQPPGSGGSDDVVKLDPRRRTAPAAAAGPQPPAHAVAPPGAAGPRVTLPSGLSSQGAVPAGLPPPPAATGTPGTSLMMPEGAAAAAAAVGPVPSAIPGLDFTSLSALAAALGLPGGPPQSSHGAPADGDATAALSAAVAAGAAGAQDIGEQLMLQLQPLAGAGFPGPPPPPSAPAATAGPRQQAFSPSGGPGSGGAPAGLRAALQQAAGLAGDLANQQQQQQQYTVDMRSLQPPGGPDQSLVFDLRQAQQQQQQQQQQHLPPPPPDLAAPGPPPGSAGGAPVIILPPGAPVPAPGTMNIPEGAVFMTQDPVTGGLVPIGPPPPPPPQHIMQQPQQQFPGPPGPPPPPGYGALEGQMTYSGPFGVEGPDGFGAGVPPPPRRAPPPPGGPRGPAGSGPRPMMRRY